MDGPHGQQPACGCGCERHADSVVIARWLGFAELLITVAAVWEDANTTALVVARAVVLALRLVATLRWPRHRR